MSNYPEIQPSDIKAGDTIRVEYEPGGPVLAVEYEARQDGDDRPTARAHRIVSRPTPPIELPSEPTLGWLTASKQVRDEVIDNVLASWEHEGIGGVSVKRNGDYAGIDPKWVTAFTPATTVPTEALDELRSEQRRAVAVTGDVARRNAVRRDAIKAFLAAVDKANEATQ